MTEDFNHLQGSETKLKNEVEELKADNIEKDTRIVYLEGQVSRFVSSLEKAREEAIVAFKKSNEYKNQLAMRTFVLMPRKHFPTWTLILSSFPLLLKAPCCRRVLRTSA